MRIKERVSHEKNTLTKIIFNWTNLDYFNEIEKIKTKVCA